MGPLTRLSIWTLLNVLGLVAAAAGMLTQIAAGSELYPSLTGPIVLIITAGLVALGPGRWTRWIGLAVPLVLGIGAAVAATMTGTFIEQLTGAGQIALLLGSWMHVVGLVAAVGGAVGVMTAARQKAAAVGG